MAANSIGKWSAQATLDANGFTSGIQKMMGGIKGFVGSQGIGMLTNLPTALGLGSISSAISSAMDTVERELDLGFLNDQLGTSVEWLSSLRTVASENSVGADQFTSAMERMNQQLGQARLGNTEVIETFERLGISLEDIRTQDFQTLFMRGARGLDQMTDRATRARTAMELFGRGGAANMLRFVRDIDSSMADVQSRGGFTTDADLQRFQEMDDAIDRMTTRWDSTWRSWLSSAAPVITRMLDATEADVAPAWATALAEHLPELTGAAGVVGFGLTPPEPSAPSIQVSQQEMDALLAGVHEFDAEAAFAAQSLTAFAAQVDPAGAAAAAAAQAMEQAAQALVVSDLRPVFPHPDNLPTDEAFQEDRRAAERDAERFIEAGRSPFERFQQDIARMQELVQSGDLTQDQFNMSALRAMDQLSQSVGETPGIGAMDFGSSEVAAIIANASNPQMDAVAAAQQQQLLEQQRATAAMERIEAQILRQNEALGQDPVRL